MTYQTFFDRLSEQVRRFRTAERGHVVITFALATIPIMGFVGAAVDYSRANSMKVSLQAALDGAALTLAKEAAGLTDAQRNEKAKAYFEANFNRPDAQNINVASTYAPGNTPTLTITASASAKTVFMNFMGFSKLDVWSSGTVKWGDATFEIALALDNSSSMADAFGGKSKVDAAKAAASALVDVIFDSPQMASKAKISVVPYTSAVNVGSEYKTASWVDANGESSIHWENITKPQGAASRFTLFDWLGENWGGCFETRPNGHGLTDAAPSAGDTLFVPMFAPDEPGTKATPGNDLSKSWGSYSAYNSYLDDGDQGGLSCGAMPSDNSSADWTNIQKRGCKFKIDGASNKKNLFTNSWGLKTGPNFMCNAVKLLRLSTDRTVIKNKISELKALGDTSIFEGVAWGWRALSPNAPFADGRPYQGNQPENKKILILLSDGNNNWLQLSNPNKSLYAPMGFYINNRLELGISTQSAANDMLNAKTKQVCENAKQKGVVIYTIGIKLPGTSLPASWSDLITKCASTENGTAQSFIATNGDQLVEVFKEIASRITKLRIAG